MRRGAPSRGERDDARRTARDLRAPPDGPAPHEQGRECDDGAAEGDQVEQEDAEADEHHAQDQPDARRRIGGYGRSVRQPEAPAYLAMARR